MRDCPRCGEPMGVPGERVEPGAECSTCNPEPERHSMDTACWPERESHFEVGER